MSSPNGQTPGAKYPVGVARQRVRELDEKGVSVRDIARILDVTTQAVRFHLKKMAEEKAS